MAGDEMDLSEDEIAAVRPLAEGSELKKPDMR